MVDENKTVSVYGKKKKEMTYKQRYWKRIKGYTKKDGTVVKSYKKRVRKRVTRKQRVGKSVRFDITGEGKELRKAVAIIKEEKLVPKERFVDVEAKEFIDAPYDYGEKGEWGEEVDSPWECPECGTLNFTSVCWGCGYVQKKKK